MQTIENKTIGQSSNAKCLQKERRGSHPLIFSDVWGTCSFFYQNIVDVMCQLRDQYHNSTGLVNLRLLHDLTLLCLYIRALPGRAKEIRTLKLFDMYSTTSFSTENVESLNALVFESDGSVVLIESDFKMVKAMGPSKDEYLIY